MPSIAKKTFPILQDLLDLPDPRQDINISHLASDIVGLTICAVIAGAEGWNDIERFGRRREAWLRRFLVLPNGIPSHDTLRRFFLLLDPDAFVRNFANWTMRVREGTGGETVAIDGKTLRHSFDNRDGKGALHMISAWATESGLSLGQVAEDAKSNEITAIPRLLDLLDLKGCLVTIDAIGCQKDIAARIIDMGADYVLAVKANQNGLHEAIADFFDTATKMNFQDVDVEKISTVEKDHGRKETRTYYLVKDLDWLPQRKAWKGLRAIGMVVRKCKTGTKTSTEVRLFITSLAEDVQAFARAVRQHWGIENSLHWVLDVDFREDQSRKRKDNSAINFAYVLRLALSLLRQETTAKLSIRAKRLEAGWDPDYLAKVMAAGS